MQPRYSIKALLLLGACLLALRLHPLRQLQHLESLLGTGTTENLLTWR